MLRWLLSAALLVAFPAAELSAAGLTGTLRQIQETGKIRIGYREAQPPMSSLGKDGTPVGYAIDLCTEIAAEAKKAVGREIKVEYVAVTAENRFEALAGDKIDLLCAATTRTIARSAQVDFTLPTFVTGASFMTLSGTDIRNNFSGKKIGVVKGTTTVVELKKLLNETAVVAEVVEFGATGEGLAALENRQIDVFAADQVVLIGLALSAEDPARFTVFSNLFSFEPFALAVRRNDADFRLVADRVLAGLYRSKDILKIYDKWFGKFAAKRSAAFDSLVQLNAIPE
jgi:glutamate/aspartate transport system substrate-binding protein